MRGDSQLTSSQILPPSLIKLHWWLYSSRCKINGVHPTSSVVLHIARRNRLGSSFIDLPNRSKVRGPSLAIPFL